MNNTNTSFTVPMPGTIGGAKTTFRININQNPPTVGIVGLGFVGGAIRDSFEYHSRLVLVDSNPVRGIHPFSDLAKCQCVFICVPSPQGDDGVCDTSILEDVLAQLKAMDYQGVIVSKCTAPPNVYERLNDEFPNLVHAPEFLTAANAVQDYANGEFAIIGGKVSAYRHEAERFIRLSQQNLKNVQHCTIGEASLAKYAINSFLATKVIFMNELWGIAVASGLDYDTIASMVKMDKRIGLSHMQVPGPDGAFGFGGACFPKDTSALLKYAESLSITPMVLDAAVRKNTFLRLTEPK
jgi:UDPglucose 6-dehydrogenase